MLRSMYSGISGMKNFQTKLDVIGNNIANVNTFGYKKGRVTFKDTMNQTISGASAAQDNRGGKNPMQVGLGSTIATIDTIHTGSSLQTTGRSLDLGIDGDGYFVVKQGDAQFYTRAGNFYLDDRGTLVNGDGLKVQAYNQNNQLGDVVVDVNAVLAAKPTKNIDIIGNLTNTQSGFVVTQQVKVIDNDGKAHSINIHLKKTSTANQWDVYVNTSHPDDPSSPTRTTSFTGSTNPGTFDLDLDGDGTNDLTGLTLNVTQLTQSNNASNAVIDPDGYAEGKLESFNIGAMGEINGVYSNGEINVLGQLALAEFSNTSGLTKAGNNLFQESINSGTANINVAGEGRGTIAAGSLEMSNVDLSEEFTEMITAQRGFQANTRIITTSDEILQELVNLKR
ncbi:flagellar hook protein FlgE [Cytobacillus firmus]|uniref:flagellar hook protein FlgE n=1 Tax=Cytobacillus firmus TaxID=1399 RepID=UPI00077C7895|nr:flagellar hook-basal body complex protein [Cytobacillus firmus]MBG9556596.1 flagellar hook protein [Cytobacillus firmus]MEC1892776.1 flagellar hook-basal body complex protein [Cytobacillus firmus]SUV03865.1 flagellar hook-basal body protein [Cytobacillus firmus]